MNTVSDFADWLSPMVVKELRQGMRSRVFVISFLLLQAALIFLAAIGLSASAKQQDIAVVTGFFWTIIGVPLLLIMPISGLNAVVNERKANTLELMFLTRLTARRIITGKWIAIVAQTVLLVCAVLPYSVLRYFQGGINLGTELFTIGVLLVSSILLSGIAVGVSPHSSRFTRALLVLAVVLCLQVVPTLIFGRITGPTTRFGAVTPWQTYAIFGWFGLLVLLAMVEFGASKIAPLAENHSTSRRLLGLVALCVFAIFASDDFGDSPFFACTAIVLAGICVGALCEVPRFVPSIYRPFARFGSWGRLAGRVLYPGWPSGVFYTLVVLAAVTGLALLHNNSADRHWIWWGAVCAGGTLIVPAAVLRISMGRVRRPFAIYLAIQVVLALLVGLAASLQAYGMTDFRTVLAMIPTCALLLSGSNLVTDTNYQASIIGMLVITLASIGLLLVKIRRPLAEIRKLEAAALRLRTAPLADGTELRTAQ